MKEQLTTIQEQQVTIATITEFSKENHPNLKRHNCPSELHALISFEWRECMENFTPKYQNDFGSPPVGSGKTHSHKNFIRATADLFASLIISQQSEDSEELDLSKKIKKIVFIKTSQLQRWNLAAALEKDVNDPEVLALLDNLENNWDEQYIPLIKEIFKNRGVDLEQVELVFLSWKDIMALDGFKQGKEDFLRFLDEGRSEVAVPFEARKEAIIKLSEKDDSTKNKRDNELVRQYLSEEYGGLLALTREKSVTIDILYPQALPIVKGMYELEKRPQECEVNCSEIKLSRLNIKDIANKKNFFPIKSNMGVSWNHQELEAAVAVRKSEIQNINLGCSRANNNNISPATQLAFVGQNLNRFVYSLPSNFPSPPNSPPSSTAQDLNTMSILIERVKQKIKDTPPEQLDPNFKEDVKMLIKNTNELSLLLDFPEKTGDKKDFSELTNQFVF